MTLEVVELAPAQGPQEAGDNRADEQERERDEQVENFHRGSFQAPGTRTRRALSTTSSELADMPSAAAHGASAPLTASGMASTL